MRLSAWPLILVLSASCGYRFSTGGGRLPDGGRRVRIPMADNRNVESWTAAYLTRALRRCAERAGLQVVADRSAPALRASVTGVKAAPRGVAVSGGRYFTREQEVLVGAQFSVELPNGHSWTLQLSERQSYLSAQDIRGTEANRGLALGQALGRLAEQAIERLARGF